MEIRRSEETDCCEIMKIYAHARRFMAEQGNPDQWGSTNWPPEALIHSDIRAGNSYICISNDKIAGTFFFDRGRDIEPTYRVIEDGAWLDDSPYGVIHRLAASGTVHGVGEHVMKWAFQQCGHLRIDTHGKNRIMQNLLKKCGFVYCGIIHVEEDGSPRLAYEKIK